jgi:Mg-chelatase subunit ChlI
MRLLPLAFAFAVTMAPTFGGAQDLELVTDEQILLKQVMTDKRAVYARNLAFSDSESRAFWPIYDEYEAKIKKLDDRFLALVNEFAARYDTLTDTDASAMLEEKMSIEKERMALKQTYTRKIAKVIPAKKALRYAQLETRIEIMLRRDVYGVIPLAH